MNHSITASKVRLIDDKGEMIGVISKQDAIKMAQSAGLDLVEVSPNADPPVCKILNYGKYKYEQQKKKNEAKKKQKVIVLKEVQIRPMIDDNDFNVKCRSIEKFLAEGNKVKISLRFKGREISRQEFGMAIFQKIKEIFLERVKVEHEPKLEGRQIIMILAAK